MSDVEITHIDEEPQGFPTVEFVVSWTDEAGALHEVAGYAERWPNGAWEFDSGFAAELQRSAGECECDYSDALHAVQRRLSMVQTER